MLGEKRSLGADPSGCFVRNETSIRLMDFSLCKQKFNIVTNQNKILQYNGSCLLPCGLWEDNLLRSPWDPDANTDVK